MSALADDLLADLDGLSDNAEEEYPEDANGAATSTADASGKKRKAEAEGDADMSDEEEEAEGQAPVGGLVLEGGVKPAEELDVEDVQQMELGNVEDVMNVAKLNGSKRMAETLKVRVPLSNS